MGLRCVGCGGALDGRDVNVTNWSPTCRSCGALFRFTPDALGPPLETASSGAFLPSSITVTADEPAENVTQSYRESPLRAGFLVLQRRWFTPAAVPLAVFAAVWNAFLIVWYRLAFSSGPVGLGIAFWFPLLHVAFGIGLAYLVVGVLCNRTSVTVIDGVLRVAHGPIPFWGGGRHALSDIDEVHAKLVTTGNVDKVPGLPSWCVRGGFRDGSLRTLVNLLGTEDEAVAIARRIRAHVGRAPADDREARAGISNGS